MNIMNIMLGRGLGGIEQAFVDYTEAMLSCGHKVTAIISPDAKIAPALRALSNPNLDLETLRNFGVWDFFAIWNLRKKIEKSKPDVILTHGTRAATFAQKSARGSAPVVSLAHNYKIHRLIGADLIIAITTHLKQTILDQSPEQNVVHIPNMIRVKSTSEPRGNFRSPPVIGALGRFVEKKGFADFLQALALLKQHNITFKAMIGGDGKEQKNLEALSKKLGLSSVLTFTGWVTTPEDFYRDIDIFCLPSLHEPFGIVLLEAFAASLPIVTTDTEGPSEIATRGKNALVVPRGNVEELAAALKTLLYDPAYASNLGRAGLETVKAKYHMETIAKQIETELLKLKR